MRVRPGEVLDGTYRLDAPLGRGGMGEVWRAFDLGRGCPVAVKFVLGLDPELLLRFEREARLAARVDRAEGVVRVHALGRHGEQPYCVMELVEGRDLAAVLADGLPPPEQLARWTAQLARTLAACHAAGVVHRDVKPANVLIAPDGAPKLADFGLARDPLGQGLTRTGDVVGSPAYMAPEQLTGGPGALDPRVDVYGLGALLYHGLTGRAPFAGAVLDVVRALEREAPPPPSALRPGLPPELEAICLRALAPDPLQRYPSAEALADALERFLTGTPAGATSRPRLVPAALAFTALAVALVLGGAAWGVARFRAQLGSGDAPAALSELEAWSEQALVPWALGLGAGPPPPPEELAGWIERLRAARATPGIALGARADLDPPLAAALERLLAHQALLAAAAGGAPPRAASGPTAAAAAAAHALAQGDYGAARAALARVGPAPPPEAAAARRAAWRRLLAASPTLDAAQGFLGELATLAPGPEREAALQHASFALATGFEALARGFDGSEPQSWRLALERARAALGAGAAAVVREAKARGLAAAAPVWEQALARAVEGGPLAARARLAALSALLGAEPAIRPPPVALADAVARAFARARELEARLALDQACFEYLGWGPPLPPDLAARLERELRAGAPMGERTEALALAAVRHGLAAGDEALDLAEITRRLEAQARPLRERYPHSRGALLLDAARRYMRDPRGGNGDGEPDPALVDDLRRVCEDPRLQDDVAPWYLARASLFLGSVLKGEVERSGRPSPPALVAEVAAAAERARALVPLSLEMLHDALDLRLSLVPRAEALEEVARLERRFAEELAAAPPAEQRQRRALVTYMRLEGAVLLVKRGQLEAGRSRAQAALRAQGPLREDDPGELFVKLAELIDVLARAKDFAEAERLVELVWRAGGYRHWRIARAAARVARDRGDRAEALARARRGLECAPKVPDLRQLVEALEAADPPAERRP